MSEIPPLSLLWDGPEKAHWTLLLAHGAGAGVDSPFFEIVAARLSERGVRVARFEFPYMRRMKSEGRRRPPDRAPVLREAWAHAVGEVRATGPRRLAIGGKSMGGRIASLVADELAVDALVCLGYPFHPPGKPETLRTAHLGAIQTPSRIFQGTRDPFGTRDEVEQYDLASTISVSWLEGAGHDLCASRVAVKQRESWEAVGDGVAGFLQGIAHS